MAIPVKMVSNHDWTKEQTHLRCEEQADVNRAGGNFGRNHCCFGKMELKLSTGTWSGCSRSGLGCVLGEETLRGVEATKQTFPCTSDDVSLLSSSLAVLQVAVLGGGEAQRPARGEGLLPCTRGFTQKEYITEMDRELAEGQAVFNGQCAHTHTHTPIIPCHWVGGCLRVLLIFEP